MKRILMIDDDPEIVDLVKSRLESHNYSVDTAHNGQEGFEKIRSREPNLIILDIAMPKMDGYTFVLELRKMGGKDIPVIVLTAKENMQDLFVMEGVKHYFIKPFIAEKLLNKLSEVLKESKDESGPMIKGS